MRKDIKISDDLRISLVEENNVSILSLMIQTEYRETKSVNLINDEITDLREFLNKELELEKDWLICKKQSIY